MAGWKRPSPLDVYKYIDKSNCGECGKGTCMEFVTDLLERKVTLEDCTHLMNDPKQQKNLAKLREMLTPPQLPVTFGVGDRACTIGGEEVFYRHQLTFFNPCAFAIEVHDELENFEETIQYLTDFVIERMGDRLTLDAIAIRCVSDDPNVFAEKVIVASEMTDLPLILCSWNVEALKTAAIAVAEKKPLLYAATRDNWEEIGDLAWEHKLPVVCFSPDLDELLSIAASLRKMGLKDLVLDPGTVVGEGLSQITVDKIYKLRLAAIEGGYPEAGYPILGVPATVWLNPLEGEKWETQYQEAYFGAILQSLDTSMVIMRSGRDPDENWILLAMMTFRQNIFSDPRVYPEVDPGIYTAGEPNRNAPIFVTCNYRMTKIPVLEDIEKAGFEDGAILLVVDAGGIAVEASVVGGQFSNTTIAEAIEEFKVFDKVDHRIVVIPGHAARFSGALEDDANCVVLVGPKDSSGVKDFMVSQWKPEELMQEFAER